MNMGDIVKKNQRNQRDNSVSGISALSKAYNPKDVEERTYKSWEKNGYFKPKISATKKPFVIVIPPPNVTGSLHMGHALNNTIQDALIRRSRMRGVPTLWIPGLDHAGIATQNVVEKMLLKKGQSRHDLGKEKFLEEVWKWRKEYGGKIIDQLKKLGVSCDWSRERFTMDEAYSEAVKVAFDHYYKKGLIYKGTRVINWCVRCQTSLSDLEVEHQEEIANLYYFRYDKKFPITIATTRPETKFGDTAVAVNPSDKRYQKYVDKTFKVNFAGVIRTIKIIADKSIDKKFGTGALGVTPAHSLVDADLASTHHLPEIKVINQYGKMNENVPETYQGLKAKEAGEKLIKYLEDQKLLSKTEKITHNLSVCSRCNRPLEPLPSKQWFLKMKDLAKPAIQAVKEGKIKFYPARWKKVYLDWMENIHDWCISRQLWWGHKIPLDGETDVLDTWFSSALWPFAVLGFPKKNKDLDYFYPTSVLSTARDIINLWVGRMIFSSLEFTGKIPFKSIYIHPTVFNKEGKRMSKSLGTGIDPLELMDKYGTDATRFGLVFQDTGVQDMKFSEEAIFMGKKFANKIWNASRFVMMNLEIENDNLTMKHFSNLKMTSADKTILKKLTTTIEQIDKSLDKFEFGKTAHVLYDFFWHDFCDKYLEDSKKQMDDPKLKTSTQKILLFGLTESLKLLHPFMPFVTEEIYQNIYGKTESIMISDWPGTK